MSSEEAIDSFYQKQGLDETEWKIDMNKKKCPDCGALHDNAPEITECNSCGLIISEN